MSASVHATTQLGANASQPIGLGRTVYGDTHLKMIRHNTATIVRNLSGA